MQNNSGFLERITLDPSICHGKPCVRGLRYPVEMILELLSASTTPQEIVQDYPDLELADVQACLSYAARLARVKAIAQATP